MAKSFLKMPKVAFQLCYLISYFIVITHRICWKFWKISCEIVGVLEIQIQIYKEFGPIVKELDDHLSHILCVLRVLSFTRGFPPHFATRRCQISGQKTFSKAWYYSYHFKREWLLHWTKFWWTKIDNSGLFLIAHTVQYIV